VYKGQPRGITNVASVDRWPLFGASETTYQSFTRQIKSGLCGLETTIRRCPYVEIWLSLSYTLTIKYTRTCIKLKPI